MKLTTHYCGLELDHPILPGASPMSTDLDMVRRLEDAGAPAIIMNSLFEEQVVSDELVTHQVMQQHNESFAEAITYMPFPEEFRLGPIEYLEQISKIKKATNLPVIASINGTTPGGWVSYASQMQQAGADALELNVYSVMPNTQVTYEEIETGLLDLVVQVCQHVSIPITVKLAPYYSALPNLALKLKEAGVSGLVLFNRHFQPDIDIVELDVKPVYLSNPSELMLRLRWLGILDAKVPELQYACTGGVHDLPSLIKSIMCGADVVQIVTAILEQGPQLIHDLKQQLSLWLETNEYPSLDVMRGCMNYDRCPNKGVYTRAHYIKQLQEAPY